MRANRSEYAWAPKEYKDNESLLTNRIMGVYVVCGKIDENNLLYFDCFVGEGVKLMAEAFRQVKVEVSML
jgi:hypothetical protein